MHGISSALLTYMRHFNTKAFTSVPWRSGEVSDCGAKYPDSNPGRNRYLYNN